MSEAEVDLRELVRSDSFPLSAKYDPQWVIDNEMGPNALWLTEWLCHDMDLKPGMRVLDMGCGKGLSSVFLAKEFGVQVWATDLWIKPTDNWQRIRQAGVQDRVFPVHAEARALPYPHDFFDAIVCVDSYFYYGSDDFYLPYFVRFIRPGGQIGIAMPGLTQEFAGEPPEHLTPFCDFLGWHTADWWRDLWQRTGPVELQLAEAMPEGCALYLQWKLARAAAGDGSSGLQADIEVLRTDGGRNIGLIRMIARRKEVAQ